jgi:arylsulfatase A-like enzyme
MQSDFSLSHKKNLVYGSLFGAVSWMTYGLVESFFLIAAPWIVRPAHEYVPLHPGGTAVVLLIYTATGLLTGGFIGLILGTIVRSDKDDRDGRFETLIVLATIGTIIIFFIINFISNSAASFGLSEYPSLIISLFLLLAVFISAGSDRWMKRLGFLLNPWSVSILLLGPAWTTYDLLQNSSTLYKLAGLACALGIIPAGAFIVEKMFSSKLNVKNKAGKYSRKLAYLIPVSCAMVFLSSFLDQSPIQTKPDLWSSSSSKNKADIMLISLDTVRADHMSLYGYQRNTTPEIDKFAREATVYTYSNASGDMTLSTHASMFSGLYASHHGAHFSEKYPAGKPLGSDVTTIAEILSDKGFLTMAVVANTGYLSSHFGMSQGFQYYDNRQPVIPLGATRKYYLREGLRLNFLAKFAARSDWEGVSRRAEEINEEVYSLLDKAYKSGKNFFLLVNYMDAHTPYIPPDPFDTLFPGKDETFDSHTYTVLYRDMLEQKRTITKHEKDHLISQYDGEIAYLDSQVGKLFERLKQLGLYDRALIIVTSDHGEALGERNLINHGVSVYQDQVFVPFIVKFPNSVKGNDGSYPVNSVDIMPTILDVLQFEIPAGIHGKSLLDLEHKRDIISMSESFPSGELRGYHSSFNRIERAAFLWPYKFIMSTSGKRELYNQVEDPHEKKNIYNDNVSVAQEIEGSLRQLIPKSPDRDASPQRVDQKALDQLKALGYIK